MFQFSLSDLLAATVRPSQGAVLPGDRGAGASGPRGRHAQALAYAANRRRAAMLARGEDRGVDLAYWKAGVSPALVRAASIRAEFAVSPLP